MRWTPSTINTANTLTADEWANAYGQGFSAIPWLWIIYIQRLCWTYGEEGALIRLNEGRREAA